MALMQSVYRVLLEEQGSLVTELPVAVLLEEMDVPCPKSAVKRMMSNG